MADSHNLALLIPILAVGGPMVIAIVYSIFKFIAQMFRDWRITSLKGRLAENGFSADEIERIVLAGTSPNSNQTQRSASAHRQGKINESGAQSHGGGFSNTEMMTTGGKPPVKNSL